MIKIDWSERALPIPIKAGGDQVDLLEGCAILFENTRTDSLMALALWLR